MNVYPMWTKDQLLDELLKVQRQLAAEKRVVSHMQELAGNLADDLDGVVSSYVVKSLQMLETEARE